MRAPIQRAFTLLLCFVLAAASGCTSYRNFRDGEIAAQTENWDEAVALYLEALERDPTNIRYRAALLRAQIEASQEHFRRAKEFQEAEVYDRALIELQQAVQLDPTNQYADAELQNVREILRAQRENRAYAGSIDELKDQTRGSRPQPPLLNPRSNEPIDLLFPERVSIFQIYRALGKAFGINVLFDPNLNDQDIAIEMEEVTAQTALETLMRAASHFYKVLDEHTILIAADTPQNRRTYEDLVIQTFFLSNAEVKDMLTILRSLVDAKKIATNEQLNAIILRDTADKVKIAERIIEANDKAKAEVVVDVELLQLDTGSIQQLGVNLDSYTVSQTLDTGIEGGGVRLSDLDSLTQNNWVLTIPNIVYQFVKNSSQAQLLAKPRLRITEGEQARLVIGDRVPIPVTTFNTANAQNGAVLPITSFQYQEVGIQIEVEPRVHHNKEVTLKLKVEVSQISRSVQGANGQAQPVIGTRTVDTTIRLQDGETNLLAGLIRTDENLAEDGVPGLSEIPVLGRLFSNRQRDDLRTDVVLTMTPHIVRNAQISEEDLLPIWVGTEANLTFRGGSPRVESEIEGPFDENPEGNSEEIQELMRRRIQRLPRGLREDTNGGEEPPPDATGVDLVPGVTDPFGSGDVETETFPEEEGPGEDDVNNQVSLDPPPFFPTSRAGDTSEVWSQRVAAGEPTTEAAPAAAEAARAPAAVRLRLEAPKEPVEAGDRFEVRLLADAGRPVSHLPLTLTYDPARLAVESVRPSTFLGGNDESTVMSDGGREGRLLVGASRLGARPGVTGQGEVLRVTFRALSPGPVEIGFTEAEALDPTREPLTTDTRPLTLRVDRPDAGPFDGPVMPASPGEGRRLGTGPDY